MSLELLQIKQIEVTHQHILGTKRTEINTLKATRKFPTLGNQTGRTEVTDEA